MSTLPGHCAIVTGAAGGIGSALTRALLAEGIDVLAIGRSGARLQALPESTTAARLQRLAADITVPADRQRIVERAAQLTRPPSMLIHAAATSGFALFADTEVEDAAAMLQTQLLAPMALTQALLPQLQARPQAAVVAVGSTFGSIGFPGFAAYSASKFALRGLFEALAREYADSTVRFQWLAPRATDTGFNSPEVNALNRELKTAVDQPDAVAAQLLDGIRRGRRRQQLGWPEKLFVRLNGLLPELVDRALALQLPIVRRHARPSPTPLIEGVTR